MGFDKNVLANKPKNNSTYSNSRVAVIKNHNTLCVIEDGNIRMRFTSVRKDELNALKSPLYSILVP